MIKQDVIRRMAEKADVTQKEAGELLEAYIETVKEGLVEDGKVQIVGLHTIEVVDRPERKGTNPQTQEPMIIPAGKRVRVRISDIIKDLVN